MERSSKLPRVEPATRRTLVGSKSKKSLLPPIVLVLVSFAAGTGAAQLYSDGQDALAPLQASLQVSEKTRAALETSAKEASDRASKAEKARAATEADLDEAKKIARVATEDSVAILRQEKEDATLALRKMGRRLAMAVYARTRAEGQLQAASSELAKLQSANDSLEAGAASAQKQLKQERAATQAAEQAAELAALSAKVHPAVASPGPVECTSTPLAPKPDPILTPTSAQPIVPPATPPTKNERTSMEDCVAVWEPAAHMSKAEWRRT